MSTPGVKDDHAGHSSAQRISLARLVDPVSAPLVCATARRSTSADLRRERALLEQPVQQLRRVQPGPTCGRVGKSPVTASVSVIMCRVRLVGMTPVLHLSVGVQHLLRPRAETGQLLPSAQLVARLRHQARALVGALLGLRRVAVVGHHAGLVAGVHAARMQACASG